MTHRALIAAMSGSRRVFDFYEDVDVSVFVPGTKVYAETLEGVKAKAKTCGKTLPKNVVLRVVAVK